MKCLDRFLTRIGGAFVRIWLYFALVEYILGHVVYWYREERNVKPFSKAYKRAWWPFDGRIGTYGPVGPGPCPSGKPGPVGPSGVP